MKTQEGFLKVELEVFPVGRGVLIKESSKTEVNISCISTGKHIAEIEKLCIPLAVDVTKTNDSEQCITSKQFGSRLGIPVVDLTPSKTHTGKIGRGVGDSTNKINK